MELLFHCFLHLLQNVIHLIIGNFKRDFDVQLVWMLLLGAELDLAFIEPSEISCLHQRGADVIGHIISFLGQKGFAVHVFLYWEVVVLLAGFLHTICR